MPDVKPIDEIKYHFKQSKHEVVPKLPMRAMIVGPSGSGKSTLLVSMILDIYRGAFERIFIWSPSANFLLSCKLSLLAIADNSSCNISISLKFLTL